MYYELLILGRLMYGPYHGYLIMHIIGEMVGPWQKVSPGTLYPLLARLERDGLIQSVSPISPEPHSRRTARAYTIANAGRARFLELMLDTSSSVGEYQRVFHLKVPHLEFLTPTQRVQLLEHYRDYCRASIRHREENTRGLEKWLAGSAADQQTDHGSVTRVGVENSLETTRHLTEQWRAELAWVERLLERIAIER
jgi:DNA-binding PadR family transcriptional regulator